MKKINYWVIFLIFGINSFLNLNFLIEKQQNYFTNWVVYTEFNYHDSKLYILNPFTNEKIDLELDEFEPDYPVWSPDKKHIAFIGNHKRLLIIPTSCMIARIDCKNQVEEIEIQDIPYLISQLEWSNDGNKIMYIISTQAEGRLFDTRLEYIDIYERKTKRIMDEEYLYNSNWSPDDTKILIDSGADWWYSDIIEYNLLNDEINFLEELNSIPDNKDINIADASYSPDGEKIVFTLFNEYSNDYHTMRNSHIYIYNISTHEYKRIINYGEAPEWSVDGKKILFNRVYSGDESGLYFYDLEIKTENLIFLTNYHLKFDWGI